MPEEQIKREDVTPDDFGRIAAQTAKQVIQQRIREAERAMMYEEYIDRVSEVVTGIVQQAGDRNNVLVDLGKVEALLPRSEQVDGERYEQGSRIKAVITEVRSGTKGPQVILSRRDPELIKTLFELEVPEIADGLVEIRGVAREPGYRSKIAVESHAQGVDPVGACVGPRGSRVRMVVSELRGEKIDIIPWNTEPARFVAKALSPARVREVYIDDETQRGDRRRPRRPARAGDRQGGPERPPRRAPDRLEGRHPVRRRVRPGRGRGGLRRRRGRARSSPAAASAILSNGKRCPNAALPGSRYCGVAAHQELATARPRRGARRAGRRRVSGARGWRLRPRTIPRRLRGPSRRRDRPEAVAGREVEPRRRRRRSARGDELPRDVGADPDVRGLRAQGAAGGARPLRRARRSADVAGRHAPGRGAYTCRRLACFERAARDRAFNRTLRRTVRVEPELARLYT